MYYSKVTYSRNFGIACHVQYCEVADDLYVTRCVEDLWNGTCGYASTDLLDGPNGVFLPEKPFPEEANIWSSEGEFTSEIVTQEEFEEKWLEATASNDAH